jgi:hypothetical protein
MLADAITSEDLATFRKCVVEVVTEPDPILALPEHEQAHASFRGLKRKYSPAIRQGMATTLAVLGAVVGDRALQDGSTGQQHATQGVRALLHSDDPAHWVYVSRASLVLARLAEIDPGGRSMNRPEASLVDALDLIAPQGAVTEQSRGSILDLLQAKSTGVVWRVMTHLVENTAGRLVFPANAPRWRDWTQPDPTRPISQVYADLIGVLGRLTTIVQYEPARAKDLVALLPHPLPQERQALLDAIMTAAAAMDVAGRREIAEKLAEFATRYQQPSRGAERGIGEDEVEAVVQAATSLASDVFTVPEVSWFSYWPRPADEIIDDVDVDKLTDEKRTAAIGKVFGRGGLAGAVELAEASEAAEIVGEYLARHTDVSDADVLALNASVDDLGSKVTLLVLGWTAEQFRIHGLEWLTAALHSVDNDQLAALLLRSAPPTAAVLQLMDAQSEGAQEAYWRHPLRGGVPDESVREYARHLLDRDLAWSVLVLLINHARKKAGRTTEDAELELRALEAVRRSSEDPRGIFDRHQYGLGQLLDQLAHEGVNQTRLAQIEYSFLPILENSRNPIAFYGELARDPKLFASIVIGSYRRESRDLDEPDTGVDEVEVDGGEGEDPDAAGLGPDVAEAAVGLSSVDLLDDAVARGLWARNGWSLLHEWRGLPGQISKHDVDFDQLKAWVESVMTIMNGHDRPTTGRQHVGQVLSSPLTDLDGTWPCRAVRDLLEQLQDPMIERGLLRGRFNQRGHTVRSPYDGGAQERTLAEKYRVQAGAVRDAWPRSGALLEDLATAYTNDARREDREVGE